MDTRELIKKVRRIEIKTNRLSRHLFSGEYHSSFKGKGMSFSEVRAYTYGDDIRSIDWNVTARLREPHVKVFEEERELSLMIVADISGSGKFGSQGQMRREVITEIGATLAFSALQNNDKVGLCCSATASNATSLHKKDAARCCASSGKCWSAAHKERAPISHRVWSI